MIKMYDCDKRVLIYSVEGICDLYKLSFFKAVIAFCFKNALACSVCISRTLLDVLFCILETDEGVLTIHYTVSFWLQIINFKNQKEIQEASVL